MESLEVRRKPGGQPGNSNARKTGLHTARIRAFNARVRACKRRARELLKLAEAELALREHSLTSPLRGGRRRASARRRVGPRGGENQIPNSLQHPTRRAVAPRPPRKGEV